jgi:hypothetical protein
VVGVNIYKIQERSFPVERDIDRHALHDFDPAAWKVASDVVVGLAEVFLLVADRFVVEVRRPLFLPGIDEEEFSDVGVVQNFHAKVPFLNADLGADWTAGKVTD